MRLPGDVDGNPFFGIHPPNYSDRDPFASRFPIHDNKEAKLLHKRSITGVTVGDIVRMLDWEFPYRMYPQKKVYSTHPDRRPWASHLYVKLTPYVKSTPRRVSRNNGQDTGPEHTLPTNLSSAGDTAAS
ncbi:hypothetical protein BC567DRAFT_252093 [Phyllosticta citribraziliensis]